MTEQSNKPPQKCAPQFRRTEVRQDTLKNVARLLSDYYQKSNKKVSSEELKKETFDIVKKMDEMANQNDPLNEQEYAAFMKNQVNSYKQQLMKEIVDPKMIATVMKSNLKKIQEFVKMIDCPPRDFKLIKQLIQFIENIPSDECTPGQNEAIKLYYEKLFLPVQKTMDEQMGQIQTQKEKTTVNPSQQNQMTQMMQRMNPSTSPSANQQTQQIKITQSVFQQTISPNQQEISSIPRKMPVPSNTLQQIHEVQFPGLAAPIQPQMKSQQSQIQMHQKPRSPKQMRSTSSKEVSPESMPQKQQQMHSMNLTANSMQQPNPQTQQTQGRQQMQNSQNPNDLIKQLFQAVRMDCAVFYSTQHQPRL